MSEREHEGWVIAAAGADVTRRFEAPRDLPGCAARAWVVLRPLTAREALRRDSVGLEESYELGPDGAARKLVRRYDHEAMLQYELEQCVLEFGLPMAAEDGSVEMVTAGRLCRAEMLDLLPTALMAWLAECLDTVNMRRDEDAGELAAAKKA